MDSANGNVATAEAQSDTAAAEPLVSPPPPVAVGEKRPAAAEEVENDGVVVEDKEPDADSNEKHKKKKLRNGCPEEEEVEEEMMRRVAEIVLVLSAMVKMRGGREPTPAEKELMAEAREKVVAICEELAPRDVFPRESLGGIIEDLGLNRLKEDQKLELRPPKPSLLEKIESTKRKMAESKSFAPQIASSPAPRPQAGNGAPSENPGMPTPPRAFQFEKPSSLPAASGGFQHSLLASNSSSTPSAMLSFQPPSNQVRPPMISAGMPTSSSSTSGFSGPSPATQTPAGHVVKATTLPLQSQPAPLGNIGARNKAAEHPSFSSQGIANMHMPPPQTAHAQTMKPTIIQAVPGSIPMHRPIQGMHYAQNSHLFSRHLEISKIVQKQLYPKPPERPAWISPSREYMTRTVTCQVCKSTINEMDNMFVCDACEKGYHLKCLPVSNQKVSARGEWHCPRCLAISNGKPFPPKYGRVTRNANTTKITSNTSGVQSPQKKPEAHSQAPPNQQKIATNVNPNEKISSHDGVGTESSGPNKKHKSEMHGTETSPDIVIKKELAGSVESCSADKAGATKAVGLQGCGNLSTRQTVKSEPSFSEGRSGDTPKLDASGGPPGSDTADGPSDSSTLNLPSSGASDYNSGSTKNVDETEAPSVVGVPLQRNDCDGGPSNGVGVSPQQQLDSGGLEKPVERPEGVETVNCHPNHEDVKPCDQDSAQENQLGMKVAGTEAEAEAEAPAMASEDGLHAVDWVGDVNGVDNNKKFYLSCCINGVVYKVYDYVLIRSSDSKLVPYKIQAMWEDSPISSKWVLINQCYFPGDLPASVGRPSAPEGNEVYESNHECTLRAGLIQGPCEVLQAKRYGEDTENGSQGAVENKDRPVFLCRWFYDKTKGVFRPIPS